MRLNRWLIGVAAAACFGLYAMPSQAGPASGLATDLGASAGQTSDVQPAHSGRRCWRHRGHWHCRHYRRWHGDYGYYDRPYFYGPTFGFSFGGHRHHRHGHHHHHRHHRH